MASIFRPKTTKPVPKGAVVAGGKARWTDRKGRAVVAPVVTTGQGVRCRVVSPTWWVEYRDHNGDRQRVPGFKDRAATLQLAARLEKMAGDVRAGVAAPAARHDGPVHVPDHLEAYRADLEARGNEPRGVKEVVACVGRILKGASVGLASAVDPDRVTAHLRREAAARGWGLRTLHTQTIRLKAFGNWLVNTDRLAANPFRRVPLPKQPDADPKHVRRAGTPEELAAVVAAARASKRDEEGMPPADRAALYTLAGYSGRRANALAGVIPEDFTRDAKGAPVRLTTTAKRNKNRKVHTVDLPPHIGKELAAWLKGKEPGKPVFAGKKDWHRHAAAMLRRDLERAGIDYRDAAGHVLDFHALRATYCTFLALAGVGELAAMEMMGVSDSKLVSQVYAKIKGRLAGEAAKLPPMPKAGRRK